MFKISNLRKRFMEFRRLAVMTAVLFGVASAPVVLSAPTYADNAKSAVCGAIESNSNCTKVTQGTNINNVITAVVNVLSIIVGVAAVIMIIIAGMKYITSAGDSNSISSAKNTLLYALVGLAVAALSQTIVQFVLKKF